MRSTPGPGVRAAGIVCRLAGLLLAMLVVTVAAAADDPGVLRSQEYDLKAAFLFNFTQFVEWPGDAFATRDEPFTIAILGDDPFGHVLDNLVANERVHDRRIVVRRFRTVEEVADCQLVFVGISEPGPLEHALSVLAHQHALTVGESHAFSARSGMIAFETNQRRLHLRVNVGVAREAGLMISSKILRQAEIVGPRGVE